MSNAVAKALWFIEAHCDQEISLEQVAAVAHVSRFHLTRAFAFSVGQPVMAYVRARRLSEAAKALAGGAESILQVALTAGYNSHEAFTRAFRDHFGITPEAFRALGRLNSLSLQEPIRMKPTVSPTLSAPRLEQAGALHFAGITERYSGGNMAGIPQQWQRFVPHLGHIPGQSSPYSYGVVFRAEENGEIGYMCAVETSTTASLPDDFGRIRVEPQLYLVWEHRGHISAISASWAEIWNRALPESDWTALQAPFFERIGHEFNGQTGMGCVELWVPVRKK